MTWYMASVNEVLKGGKNYFYDIPENIKFHFDRFKKKRDESILRLNGAYERNWSREGIDLVHGTARFIGQKEIQVDLQDGSGKANYTAPNILIATGTLKTSRRLGSVILHCHFRLIESSFFAMCLPRMH
jgi:glutathione reductase (NADPH)